MPEKSYYLRIFLLQGLGRCRLEIYADATYYREQTKKRDSL